MTDELVKWEPASYDGTDLLPVAATEATELVAGIPVVGRENIGDGEVTLPTLKLLQGMSDEVTDGVEGARPGKFFLTSTQEVMEGPIRALIISHSKSNVMYPKAKDPRYAGLKKCLSRDAVEGTEYGFCADCQRHEIWGPNNAPPLCAESNNFTLMTSKGPAVIRFKRTNHRTSKDFIINWRMTQKNLWHHPVEIRIVAETDKDADSTFYKMKMQWNTRERIPDAVQLKAFETWEALDQAANDGRLKSEGDDDE